MPRPPKPSADALGSALNTLVAMLSDALVAGVKSAIATGSLATAPAPTKRGPGRPPKGASTTATPVPKAVPAKRGPGRPPKSVPAAATPTKGAAPPKRGPGRPPKNAVTPCLVIGCGRKTVAKGLCQGHYRKAVRLGVAKKLDKANLAKLAKDGRATRWAKKR